MDNIKIMESMENGYIYSNIVMKLYLKSLKYNGQLMMTERIPYDPDKIDIMSKVLNHDVDHLKAAIKVAVELDLITILDTGEMWITDIQNFIGHSSTESERKAKYRAKLKSQKLLSETTMGQCPEDVSPELELELELDKDINYILDSWNKQNLQQHKISTVERNIKKSHKDIIDDYGIDVTVKAIVNYSYIIKSKDHYFNFSWTLWDFVKRGLDRFVDSANPLENFKNKNSAQKEQKSIYNKL